MTFLEVVQSGNYLVLDTETTGLDHRAEICQIAIVDSRGTVLLDTLVKPTQPIPPEATKIHGITTADVINAPKFVDLYERILGYIEGQHVLIYNADYDSRLLVQSAAACYRTFATGAVYHCVMKLYAERYGDWDDYFKSYRWQSLAKATKQQDLNHADTHTALGDALATLALVKAVWCADGH